MATDGMKRKEVAVLLARHWVQESNKPDDTSTWGLSSPLDLAPGKQDRCEAAARLHLPHFTHIVDWRSSPVLRARQSTARASEIYGTPISVDDVKQEAVLASPDFDLEEKIYADLKAEGVKLDTAVGCWQGFFDHSPNGSQLAHKIATDGAGLVRSIAKSLSDGETAVLYTHHPYGSWIASGLNGNVDQMFDLEKGGILAVYFKVENDEIVSFEFEELKLPAVA